MTDFFFFVRAAACWALYNLIRYFLAYNIYTSKSGQSLSLALGTITTFALAFVMSAALVSVFRHYLQMHHVPIDSILCARTLLQYLLSAFLLTPAFVSFVLVITWDKSPDPELRPGARCHLDIDPVWSVPRTLCSGAPRRGAWLALSSVRLIFTFATVVSTFDRISPHSSGLVKPDRSGPLSHSITSLLWNTPTVVEKLSLRLSSSQAPNLVRVLPSTLALPAPRWLPHRDPVHALDLVRAAPVPADDNDDGDDQIHRRPPLGLQQLPIRRFAYADEQFHVLV